MQKYTNYEGKLYNDLSHLFFMKRLALYFKIVKYAHHQPVLSPT